uniref:SFRICE_038226 n=1 Tax=Spodoptera frugiperda TaxID=7108 RepID=A0A2H1V8B9_SPOFR
MTESPHILASYYPDTKLKQLRYSKKLKVNLQECLSWNGRGLRHGVLTYRLTQVLTGHGSFGRFLFLIGREETAGCHLCEDRPEDTVEHTMAVCSAWAEHRQVLRDVVSDGDLSRPALVQAMVRSEREWDAVSSFCEAVMLAKEEAGRPSRETLRASRIAGRSPATVSAGLRTASKGSSSPEQNQTRACGASRSARASMSHQTTTDGAQ